MKSRMSNLFVVTLFMRIGSFADFPNADVRQISLAKIKSFRPSKIIWQQMMIY